MPYSLNVDQSVWLQQKITAGDGAPNYFFDSVVAISSDGKTMLVGSSGKNDDQGTAYVLVRSNGTWKEVAELAPSDGEPNEYFGSTVALSPDGSTALIGAWNKTVNGTQEQGAAYVFTTSDRWATHAQGIESTASDGSFQADFGNSVAFSANGTTAVVGGTGRWQ